ncbi:hypothetical protein [Neomegalonema sp.]|uniref:hypothetical protein n=1 Tax=Neomegalonema sp. TaxID=2039713 RepID=UPI00262A3373|nr:hypothetical protein [Neomegalonema sp.]MDD2867064.1 hypothetical protein [Neomegalonema sp.]
MTEIKDEIFRNDGASAVLHRDAPPFEERRAAAVGRWRCLDPVSGADLLNQMARQAAGEGFRALVGPMNGDTWGAYRLVTETDGSPPFPLEPVNGLEDLTAFRVAGFSSIADYVSTRLALDRLSAFAPEEGEIRDPALRLRFWDGKEPEALLGRLHALSLKAFARNPFFRPIDRASFSAHYAPIMPLVDPRFVILAEKGPDLVGFLFGYPNFNEGPQPESAVIKTYASLQIGLGRRMADLFHRRARDMGFNHVIHALMREDNRSRDSSRLYGAEVFRRYALMARRLP